MSIANEPGAPAPRWPRLTVAASFVKIGGFVSTETGLRGLEIVGNHVTVANFSANAVGAAGSADHLNLLRANVGPNNGCTGPEDGIQAGDFFTDITTNVTLDDVTVHGTSGFKQCGTHMDGIQAAGCQNWTIRNSHFYDNDTSHFLCLAHDAVGNDPVDDVVIENSQFGTVAHPGSGINLECGAHGSIVVRNNTFYGNVGYYSPDCSSATILNNYFVTGSTACYGAGSFVYNVTESGVGVCGTKSRTCTAVFVDPDRLTTGNGDIASDDPCVKNAADPARYPLTDIHGNPRWAPDAGATAATQRPSKHGCSHAERRPRVVRCGALFQTARAHPGQFTPTPRYRSCAPVVTPQERST